VPRMGRVVLPNYPHHVVQRGHNRQVVFASETTNIDTHKKQTGKQTETPIS